MMANEIKIQCDMSLTKGGLDYRWAMGRQSLTQTGTLIKDIVVSIATSETTIAVDDVGTPGFVALMNLDDTNYVQWGVATTVYTGRMIALGQVRPFQLDAGVQDLYLKANTAACEVRIVVFEL
jgi:hypothetical protein